MRRIPCGHAVQREGSEAWEHPGVYQVDTGVFRIPLPMPQDGLRAVNVYVLVGELGLTLIDAGWDIPEARTLLQQGIEATGFSMNDIKLFLITHLHRDHYELSLRIRREVGATVALGQGERPGLEKVRRGGMEPYGPQLASLRALGAEQLAERIVEFARRERLTPSLQEMPDDWIVGGVMMVGDRKVLALPTPGHTRGHVVFHDEAAGLLFSGDHVLPSITPSIGFEVALAQNPLGDFMDSVRLIRGRTDARLLPAHGPVTASVHERADQLLAHHDRRLEQTEHALNAGARTGLELAGRLTWTRRERRLDDMNDFNQMLAVCETAAHAQLLVSLGRATSDWHDGTIYYSPVRPASPVSTGA